MPKRERRQVVIGIDNGTTGSIGMIGPVLLHPLFVLPPTKCEQDYTKAKNKITRINEQALCEMICLTLLDAKCLPENALAVLERPLVNPKMFKTTGRALRALEATLIAIEELGIPHIFIDSREWQKSLLPAGTKGTPELKRASMEVGCRLYPSLQSAITAHGDADGLLIAEWAWRSAL